MNSSQLKQAKMAWIAAREAGDTQTQLQILKNHEDIQDELIDFIAAYHAMEANDNNSAEPLLEMTQKAMQRALNHVLPQQAVLRNLTELRKQQHLSKADVAQRLRLSLDVWNKFESGTIELISLSQQQLGRLAGFFQVTIDQFADLLTASKPSFTPNMRQTLSASRSAQQSPPAQTFMEAINRSSMSQEDKKFWLD